MCPFQRHTKIVNQICRQKCFPQKNHSPPPPPHLQVKWMFPNHSLLVTMFKYLLIDRNSSDVLPEYFILVLQVCEIQSINQTVNLGRGMSGPVCVKYYCTPPAQSHTYAFWNSSMTSLRDLSFNFTKTITIINVFLANETGNTTNRTGHQACLHVTNARIEYSTLIKFIITDHNFNVDVFTYIHFVVKGNSDNWF